MIRFAFVMILLSFALTCTFPGVRLNDYPENLRRVYLHNFTNTTFQPDVNVELNRRLRREIHRRKDFILTENREDASLHLYGDIVLYTREGRMFDNYRTPIRFELIIGARIRLRESSSQQSVILSTEEIAATEFSEIEGYRETEQMARDRLLTTLSAQIHNSMTEAFARHFGSEE